MEIDKGYMDTQDALKRVGGNKDLLVRLLTQFTATGYIASLEEALAAGDVEAATRTAHSIKGTGANLSLPKLTAAALEMEQKLKNGEDHGGSLAALKEVYDTTSQQIAKYIEG